MQMDPVPAFAALAHPQRLAVMRLLMLRHPQALAAGDLAARLRLPASTLSGYLAQLRDAGLVRQERHGTSLHYAAVPEAAQVLSAAWITRVCGGRGWPEAAMTPRRVRTMLVLGRGNGGPSLVAEAVLRARVGAHFEVLSAAVSACQAPDVALMGLLARRGFDAEALWSKPLSAVTGADSPRPDVVIALGESAAEVLLEKELGAHRVVWRLAPGQAGEQGGAALIDGLAARIERLAALDLATAGPAALQRALDAAALV